ncbi:SDR family oxidoreductase [Undibacterium crateris]|uniref:SDR family oxidoreductase n=1 Tax=Undibacterium crateris TaxID=2528175 RepID=UPI001389FDD2|nr:SDR family oxidoreductase [Undibacterium crateris]NDI85028.1 SDR family oxidoreductase [Undibacterium crateris]
MMNVFITGASSGLGAALARSYAQQGARVALVARRQAQLEQIRLSLPHPERHCVYALDVTDHAALRQAAQSFIAEAGAVQVVIANAGVSMGTLSAHQEDYAVFERIVQTNLMATVATFSAFIPHMQRIAGQQACRLVGIGSVAGIRGLPGAEAYSASKAAVISYCESLRVELARDGIRVVTIAPGYIDTPMTQVNTFPMPFLMPAERFATQAVKTIAAGSSYRVIPWQMGIVAKLLRLLPNPLYDFIFSRTPQKPRQSDNQEPRA